MQKTIFFSLFLIIVASYLSRPAGAQDTFGPTCVEGITCTPTPQPSRPPQPPPPTQLPVTGPVEVTLSVLGIGMLVLLAGASGVVSYFIARK